MEVQKQTSGRDFQRLEAPSIFLEKCGNLNHTVKRQISAYCKAMYYLSFHKELWRMTGIDELKSDRFHRVCLKKMMRSFRSLMKISNEELYCLTSTKQVSVIIRERRWRYIGHILRRESSSHVRVALTRKPEGRREKGRPKETRK